MPAVRRESIISIPPSKETESRLLAEIRSLKAEIKELKRKLQVAMTLSKVSTKPVIKTPAESRAIRSD